MGLQEQQVSFKFAGGVETKMDSKAVPPVRLLALENGVFSRAISIKKRNGYSLLSRAIDGSASRITGARRLAVRDDELLLFTAGECYSKQSGADQWTDAGPLLAPLGSDRPAVHTGTAQTTPDHASSGGVAVYAWEDSLGGVWWTTVDATNGRVYRAPAQAHATGERPRCIAVGEVLHIYYAVPADRSIYVLVINPSTPTADVTPLQLVADLDTTNPTYDACTTARHDSDGFAERIGTPAVIAWHEYGTTNIRVGYVTAGGALGSPASGHPSAHRFGTMTTGPIAVAYRATSDESDTPPAFDEIGVAHVNGTDLVLTTLVPGVDSDPVAFPISVADTDTVALDDDPLRIALSFSYATHALVAAVEQDAAETSNHFTMVASMLAGTAAAVGTIRSLGLASRAFQAGNDTDVFAMFVHDTTYFNTYLTLRLADFVPAGRHLPGAACGPTQQHLPSVQVADNVVTAVVPYKSRLTSENNDKFTESALRIVTMDFDSEDTHQTAQFGRGLYMSAAMPQHYDGRIWSEQGFNMGPEHITSTPGGGGSLTPSSTYQYKVWYEWTDAQGEIHRGPESVGVTVVTTGGDTRVALTVPTLRVTRKDNVRICVARSLPGDTARLWRVSSLDSTTNGDTNGYIANDITIDSISFADELSDTDLQLQEEIYTIGGILSNDPCPLGSHVAVGKNRLFFTDAQADSVVRFSKRIATGFGAECAPELMHDIDPYGGRITSLAVMDDVVFVFKASCIFAFNGDGPYEDGGSTSGGLVAGFSSSQIISSDVGCTDPSSIVLTPQGLMFSSSKGIYLLARSREVTYIGAPVEAYNGQSVRRAIALPDRTAALFLTDSGSTLYYDYLFQQWSTFTNHEGYDAAVVGNVFHYLRTNDIVFRETIGVHSDGGARIILRFETAWLHLMEHLQGFQRFWKLLLLGTWTSPHQLAVQHRLSYEEPWSDPYYLDATGDTESDGWITGDNANPIGEDPIIGTAYGEGNYGEGDYGGEAPGVYQWRYGIHENGQAVQFRFEDFEKAGLHGASFELTEMTITGGIKKPDTRPFSAARST